jgi:hypothetical protein
MKPKRLLGIVFLIAAAVLLFFATDASHSLSDHVSNLFTGHFTDRTTWLFGGAMACGVLGVFMVLNGAKAGNA